MKMNAFGQTDVTAPAGQLDDLFKEISPQSKSSLQSMNMLTDTLFKILFGSSHKENMEALLRDILGYSVTVLEYLNIEQSVKIPTDKVTRLDLLVKTDKGVIINVEVQIRYQDFYLDRVQYYWAREFSGQLSEGGQYEGLHKVIHISILQQPFFKKDKRAYRRIVLKDYDTNEIYDSVQEYYFLEIGKLDTGVLQNWIDLFNGNENNSDSHYIKKIFEEVRLVLSDEKIRRQHDAELKAIRDDENVRQSAIRQGLAEGRAEGREKGLAEGREKGLAEGRVAGRAEGRVEGEMELIRSMLKRGLTPEKIAEFTGKDVNYILNLL